MENAEFRKVHASKPKSPEGGQGISWGEDGPTLGPIRLLDKTARGFQSREVEDLNFVFSRTFDIALDCADLAPGLKVVAQALNEGDFPRAMIATVFLHLPTLSRTEADRATTAEALLKASADDPKHPGWPPGTPGGRGGKFRPKEAEVSEEAIQAAKSKLRSTVMRRAFRSGIRQMLTIKRLARLTGEAVSTIVPVLDVAGDIAGAADLIEMANELRELRTETNAALQFAEKGPRTLEELRLSPDDESFSSYGAFKKEDIGKRFGSAPPGEEYHHLVEQGGANNPFPASELQSTRNIVPIPKLLHEEINIEYARIIDTPQGQMSLRDSLKGMSFEEQYQIGLKVMRDVGILQ